MKRREYFPGVWERATSMWPGFMTRKPEFLYRTLRFPNPEPSPGESSLFLAVYEESGSIDGYVMYRFLRGTDESSLKIIELIPTTDKAHAALWRYCFDVDLIWRVSYDLTPIDDPLWWMLADPRRLKRTRYDAIWLRIVDVPAALSARKYASAGKLVIEVVDEFCPWAGGSFELDADRNRRNMQADPGRTRSCNERGRPVGRLSRRRQFRRHGTRGRV